MTTKPHAKGITRIVKAFGYSLAGLKAAYKDEAAFRQDVLLVIAFGALAFWLDVTFIERILLLLSLFFILFAELINTAIEATVDRISEERHPQSKKAKDVGSALVFLSLVQAAMVWGLIFLG